MAAANGFTGVIASGSGSSYTVTLSGGGGTVSATCLGIASDQTIPVGFGVTLVKTGSSYYFTVPLWADA